METSSFILLNVTLFVVGVSFVYSFIKEHNLTKYKFYLIEESVGFRIINNKEMRQIRHHLSFINDRQSKTYNVVHMSNNRKILESYINRI